MGTSTSAILCYGISLDEDAEPPWANTPDGDILDWWRRTICGYVPPFELFTPEGDYVGGVEPAPARVNAYFAEQAAFDTQHPLPVEMVMHGSREYPMWIVAARNTGREAYRGTPEQIDPRALRCSPAARRALREFCRTRLGVTDRPRWLLASLWF